jgi:hypothetical protein
VASFFAEVPTPDECAASVLISDYDKLTTLVSELKTKLETWDPTDNRPLRVTDPGIRVVTRQQVIEALALKGWRVKWSTDQREGPWFSLSRLEPQDRPEEPQRA